MSGHEVALWGGTAMQVVGLCLASLDIWLEVVASVFVRLAAWCRERASRSWRWITRKIFRRHRVIYGEVGPATESDRAGRITGYKSIPEDVPLEEQVRRLRCFVIEVQQITDDLRERIESVDREAARKVEALRDETNKKIEHAIEVSRTTYRGWRAVGFVLLLIGTAVVAVVSN